MRQLAEEYWQTDPICLLYGDIIEFLGYSRYSIYNWKNKLGLKVYPIEWKAFLPQSMFSGFHCRARFLQDFV